MLGFGESFVVWALSTVIPAFIGLALITIVGKALNPKYVVAFAIGIFLWFFVDTIGGSALLDVNAGFSGGVQQLGLIILFAVGVIGFFWVNERFASTGDIFDYRIPFLVPLALGIHGLGEGTAFGSTAALTSSNDLLQAFGGVSAGVAYALHKMLEPMIIGACYIAYTRKQGSNNLRNIGLLTLLFAIPSLLGDLTGYFIAYDATYFFALGTGTSAFALFCLAKPIFSGKSAEVNLAKLGFSLALGFLCIYMAALFHS